MTATQIPTPRSAPTDLAAVAELVDYMQALVFAGAIDTAHEQPSLKVWPDHNPAYTAGELEARSGSATATDLIDAINACAAHLARV